MKTSSHLISGAIIGTSVAYSLYGVSKNCIIASSISYLASILPDIDIPTSALGKLFPFLSKPIHKVFGHRTITHSVCTWFIFFIILFLKIGVSPVSIGLLSGIFSHLLMDSLTKRGVPICYPISGMNLSFSKRKTGDRGEKFWSIAMSFLVGIVAMSNSLRI